MVSVDSQAFTVSVTILFFSPHPILFVCTFSSYPMAFYPIVSYFILPTLTHNIPSNLIWNNSISYHPIISYSLNLSYPILSYPILSYPILSYPILSYPILSYPILSYFHLFLSTHLTIPSHPDHAIPYHVCSILLWHLQNWSPKGTYEIVVFCVSCFIINKLFVEHNNSKAIFNDFFRYLFVRFTFFSWFYCIFAIKFLAFFLVISILIWHFWAT